MSYFVFLEPARSFWMLVMGIYFVITFVSSLVISVVRSFVISVAGLNEVRFFFSLVFLYVCR